MEKTSRTRQLTTKRTSGSNANVTSGMLPLGPGGSSVGMDAVFKTTSLVWPQFGESSFLLSPGDAPKCPGTEATPNQDPPFRRSSSTWSHSLLDSTNRRPNPILLNAIDSQKISEPNNIPSKSIKGG